MRATHSVEGDLLSSKFTDNNVTLIHKTLAETCRMMLGQISGHRGPAKLTHKISHHGIFLRFGGSLLSEL